MWTPEVDCSMLVVQWGCAEWDGTRYGMNIRCCIKHLCHDHGQSTLNILAECFVIEWSMGLADIT